MKIEDKFKELRLTGRKAFIAYVPFGFPQVKYTKDIVLALAAAGADVIELGIPFSDPLADGPVIQAANTQALSGGANRDNLLVTLDEIKKDLGVPLVVMTYYNPVFRLGLDVFLEAIAARGVAGVIVVDLPVEESAEYLACAKRFGLEPVFLVTPATAPARAKRIAQASKGFLYYVSVTGITGPKEFSYASLAAHIKKLKRITALPVCAGFGIHSRAQVEQISSFSDGVIVGSSIVSFIRDNFSRPDFLAQLKGYIRSLRDSHK